MKNLRTNTLLSVALVLFGAAGACGGMTGKGGSETNWLGSCSQDGDCGVGQCLCGVCTTSCTANDACPGGTGPDTCATTASAAHALLCGGVASPPPGICVAGCGAGAMCTGGFECSSGTCVPSSRVGDGGKAGDGGLGTGGTAGAGGTVGAGAAESDAGPGTGSPGTGGSTTSSTLTTRVFTDVVSWNLDPAHPDELLLNRCLPFSVPSGVNGRTACSVIQIRSSLPCTCDGAGQELPDPKVLASALPAIQSAGVCDTASTPACSSLCFCGVKEMTGSASTSCLQDAQLASAAAGFCYVDPAAGKGSQSLVSQCSPWPGARKLRVRVQSPNPPGEQQHVVIACRALTSASVTPSGPLGALGDSCVPSDETRPDFAGFSENEVNVETGTPQCSTGVCIASNFRGRVSCTYGQVGNPSDLTEVDPAHQTCMTTGASPVPVTIPVPQQLTTRRPAQSVYCTCRCDGPDASATYCACPSGFTCTKQVTDYGFGTAGTAGSYCLKDGTQVADPTQLSVGNKCNVAQQNCGPGP